MWYEINITVKVGKRTEHFFATHKRSIDNQHKLLQVLKVLDKKFPLKEGYELSVTRWEERGEQLDKKELLAIKALAVGD